MTLAGGTTALDASPQQTVGHLSASSSGGNVQPAGGADADNDAVDGAGLYPSIVVQHESLESTCLASEAAVVLEAEEGIEAETIFPSKEACEGDGDLLAAKLTDTVSQSAEVEEEHATRVPSPPSAAVPSAASVPAAKCVEEPASKPTREDPTHQQKSAASVPAAKCVEEPASKLSKSKPTKANAQHQLRKNAVLVMEDHYKKCGDATRWLSVNLMNAYLQNLVQGKREKNWLRDALHTPEARALGIVADVDPATGSTSPSAYRLQRAGGGASTSSSASSGPSNDKFTMLEKNIAVLLQGVPPTGLDVPALGSRYDLRFGKGKRPTGKEFTAALQRIGVQSPLLQYVDGYMSIRSKPKSKASSTTTSVGKPLSRKQLTLFESNLISVLQAAPPAGLLSSVLGNKYDQAHGKGKRPTGQNFSAALTQVISRPSPIQRVGKLYRLQMCPSSTTISSPTPAPPAATDSLRANSVAGVTDLPMEKEPPRVPQELSDAGVAEAVLARLATTPVSAVRGPG